MCENVILLHEEKPEYDHWFRLVLILPLGLAVAAVISAFVSQDYELFFVLMGEAVLVSLVFYFIVPRKYQIHQDSLRIVLGTPFTMTIHLSTIREAKRATGLKAWVYSGVRFATSSRYVVEIVRSKGLNYVISPQNGDIFVEQLNQAVKSNRLYVVK